MLLAARRLYMAFKLSAGVISAAFGFSVSVGWFGGVPGLLWLAAGCALVLYVSIIMPIRVFVNSYGQYNALKI